jgi:hypothetical protein
MIRGMIRFVRDYFRLMAPGCSHRWVEDGMGRRYCGKCDKRQMLYENRYPQPGEPKYTWR